MHTYTVQIRTIVLVSIFSMFTASSVFAKSCWVVPNWQGESEALRFVDSVSDVVFEGYVIETKTTRSVYLNSENKILREEAIVLVEAVHKGELSEKDHLLVVGQLGDCSCIRDFEVGHRYKILARVSDEQSLVLNFCDHMLEIDANM